MMGALSEAGRMSWNQEADIKAAIMKAVEKGSVMNFPRVMQAINWFDPSTGDLKCLTVLDEIGKPEVTDMKLVLQKAEIGIK